MTNAKGMTVEAMLKEIGKGVAAQLAKADQGVMSLRISIDGRTLGPDLKIELVLGNYAYSDDQTKGGDLNEVVKEFLRRKGWTSRNAPITSGLRDEREES